MPGIIESEHRDSGGRLYAITIVMSDGARADVRTRDGRLSWADPQVWDDPERYGFERFFCGCGRCEYGGHDCVRMAGGPPILDDDAASPDTEG